MDLHTLFLALPVFILVYQGVGLLMEARADQQWGTASDKANRPVFSQTAVREFISVSSKIGVNKVILRNKLLAERLDLLLLRAGHPFEWKAEDFLFFKELAAVGMLFVAWEMGADQLVLYLVAAFFGFYLPDVYMKGKGTARQAVIQRHLPGFIDLTSLALESGLDLLAAIERILEKMKANSLREELYTLLQETRLGTPRKEALQHLAFRVNLADLHSLTSIIIQSEELGTGLAGVLRSYSEDMRNRRILRAEDIAGKMPVKLLFPMMVFFFPIVFVIIFGPLALSFMSGYK